MSDLQHFTEPVSVENSDKLGYKGDVVAVTSIDDPADNGTYALVTIEQEDGDVSTGVFYVDDEFMPVIPFPLLTVEGDANAALTKLEADFAEMLRKYEQATVNVTDDAARVLRPGDDLT